MDGFNVPFSLPLFILVLTNTFQIKTLSKCVCQCSMCGKN